MTSLEKDVMEKLHQCEEMDSQLEGMRDYNDIKKELGVLKLVEFSVETSGRLC